MPNGEFAPENGEFPKNDRGFGGRGHGGRGGNFGENGFEQKQVPNMQQGGVRQSGNTTWALSATAL